MPGGRPPPVPGWAVARRLADRGQRLRPVVRRSFYPHGHPIVPFPISCSPEPSATAPELAEPAFAGTEIGPLPRFAALPIALAGEARLTVLFEPLVTALIELPGP